MTNIEEVINEHEINEILKQTCSPSQEQILKVLEKAAEKKGLNLRDAGFLLNITDEKLIEKMFSVSGKIKNEIYGERLVFFAPLYVSSFCINNCDYCGFHCGYGCPLCSLLHHRAFTGLSRFSFSGKEKYPQDDFNIFLRNRRGFNSYRTWRGRPGSSFPELPHRDVYHRRSAHDCLCYSLCFW